MPSIVANGAANGNGGAKVKASDLPAPIPALVQAVRQKKDNPFALPTRAGGAPTNDGRPTWYRRISDCQILNLAAYDAARLSWSLNNWTCVGDELSPTYLPNPEYRATLVLNSFWQPVSEHLSKNAEYGLQIINRIWTLRTDLQDIVLAEGGSQPGIQTFTWGKDFGVRCRGPEPSMLDTVFGIVGSVFSAFAAPGIGLVPHLVLFALNTLPRTVVTGIQMAQLNTINAETIKAYNSISAALSGFMQVAFDEYRNRLVALGYLRENLSIQEAMATPTSELAWAWATALGVPHPAMILPKNPADLRIWATAEQHAAWRESRKAGSKVSLLKSGQERSPQLQEDLLQMAAHDIDFARRLETQARVDELLLNPNPTKDFPTIPIGGLYFNCDYAPVNLPWPYYSNRDLHPAQTIMGVVPPLFDVGGDSLLQPGWLRTDNELTGEHTRDDAWPAPIKWRGDPKYAAIGQWLKERHGPSSIKPAEAAYVRLAKEAVAEFAATGVYAAPTIPAGNGAAQKPGASPPSATAGAVPTTGTIAPTGTIGGLKPALPSTSEPGILAAAATVLISLLTLRD